MELIERQIADNQNDRISNKSRDEKLKIWNSIKDQFKIGDKLQGKIYYKAYYGVWLDVGREFPALLRIPDMIALDYKKFVDNEVYQLGETIELSFVWMNEVPDKIDVSESAKIK